MLDLPLRLELVDQREGSSRAIHREEPSLSGRPANHSVSSIAASSDRNTAKYGPALSGRGQLSGAPRLHCVAESSHR
jgi:hypothetical protein